MDGCIGLAITNLGVSLQLNNDFWKYDVCLQNEDIQWGMPLEGSAFIN